MKIEKRDGVEPTDGDSDDVPFKNLKSIYLKYPDSLKLIPSIGDEFVVKTKNCKTYLISKNRVKWYIFNIIIIIFVFWLRWCGVRRFCTVKNLNQNFSQLKTSRNSIVFKKWIQLMVWAITMAHNQASCW